MAALTVGHQGSGLHAESNRRQRVLVERATGAGPVVLAFFKVSCPTCQYAFPFLERLHRGIRLDKRAVKLVGVSQNTARETAAFTKQFGVTFP